MNRFSCPEEAEDFANWESDKSREDEENARIEAQAEAEEKEREAEELAELKAENAKGRIRIINER